MLIILEGSLWVIRFFFGACIFSFLNVVVDRLPREESVVQGRSHCNGCGKMLTGWELIPCVSFLALGGKCKSCKGKIPVRDFWSELFGGAAFVGCGLLYGCGSLGILSLKGAVIFTYLGILLVVALIDQDTQIIYDRFHLMILVLAVGSMVLFPELSVGSRLLGAVIIALPMLLLTLAIPGAFGGGDIKLMAVSGLFLGAASTVCAMFLAILTGGGYAAVMLKTGKLGKKDHFAFGPFLALGLAAAALWGEQIVSWYVQFL